MLKLTSLKLNKKQLRDGLLTLLVVGTFGCLGYFGYNYYNTQKELSQYKGDPTLAALKEKTQLLETVKKLVQTPENEEPTIATVTNAFRLKGQTFFAQAENGDKVLIYQKSGRAILYRPNTKKIIEAAPVNITDLQNTVDNNLPIAEVKQTSESVLGDNAENKDATEPARIAIYNGTQSIQGLASRVSTKINSKFSSDKIKITELSNSDKYFEQTIVVNITGKYANLTTEMAKFLNGKEEAITDSEDFPNVDVLIILGKDFDETKLKL